MAHFAKVINNMVVDVLVLANTDCDGGNFPESESAGQVFLASLGLDGEWKQTSYNGNFRGRYAGIGYMYDAGLDEFVAPIVGE